MDKYSIGQRLVIDEDVIVETLLTETKNTLKKGTRMYVGVDKFLHLLDGSIIPTKTEVVGYSVKGISEFIYKRISRELPIDDMLEAYELESVELQDKISDALEELGFYDTTGNRS